MRTDASVTQLGLHIHRKFSKVAARDGQGRIVWRQRLDHCDRTQTREQLAGVAAIEGLIAPSLRKRRRREQRLTWSWASRAAARIRSVSLAGMHG